MDALRCLLLQKAFYFTTFFICTGVAVILAFSTDKINCFILLNSLHTKSLDLIFINLTFLGDGLFSIITAVLLLLIWKLRRLPMYIIAAYLVSGIAAQVLKSIYIAPRPKEIINARLYSSFLDGITCSGWNSFPSGHATSVFALATILALYHPKISGGLFFLLMAIIAGYSRIYLGQHFLPDVIAGAVLGTGTAVLLYHFGNFTRQYFQEKKYSVPLPQNNSYASGLAGN